MSKKPNSVTIFLEERFDKLADGTYHSLIFNDDFWSRYLNVFDEVYVVARAKKTNINSTEFSRKNLTTNPCVFFHEVPYYHGGKHFISVFFKILFFMNEISKKPSGSFILRMPGLISVFILPFLVVRNKKYGIELVGDPYDVFGSGGVGKYFSKVLQMIFTTITVFACARAASVAYVTKSKMQKRYPPKKGVFFTNYSSISLPRELIKEQKNICDYDVCKSFRVLMVGSMDQMYKGFDLVILSMERLVKKFPNLKIIIIGDGIYRKKLEDLAFSLGVQDNFEFLGRRSRNFVLEAMESMDFFIMPSRTEGLPRALIEAMAKGLPAIASNVGGIPELLERDFLFESENVDHLSKMLEEIIPDKNLRQKMSKNNIIKSWDYEESTLQERRDQFYRALLVGNQAGEEI